MAINEGPVILRRNGRIFMVYSASTTWSEDYSLGMLTMEENGDPMDPKSWTKSMQPVFCKSVENGVYATGHNSFTQSPDGKEDWTFTMHCPRLASRRPCDRPASRNSAGSRMELRISAYRPPSLMPWPNRPENHVFGFITSRSCKGLQCKHG